MKSEPQLDRIVLMGIDRRDYVHGPRKLERLLETIDPDVVIQQFSANDLENVIEGLEMVREKFSGNIPETALAEDLTKLAMLMAPWYVGEGNAFVHERGKELIYPLHPTVYTTGKNFFMQGVYGLLHAAGPEGYAAGMWKVNNILQQRYGPPITDEHIAQNLELLTQEEGSLQDTLRVLGRRFIDPWIGTCNRYLRQAVREVAEEGKSAVVLLEMRSLRNTFGTLYHSLKQGGIQRIPLVGLMEPNYRSSIATI